MTILPNSDSAYIVLSDGGSWSHNQSIYFNELGKLKPLFWEEFTYNIHELKDSDYSRGSILDQYSLMIKILQYVGDGNFYCYLINKYFYYDTMEFVLRSTSSMHVAKNLSSAGLIFGHWLIKDYVGFTCSSVRLIDFYQKVKDGTYKDISINKEKELYTLAEQKKIDCHFACFEQPIVVYEECIGIWKSSFDYRIPCKNLPIAFKGDSDDICYNCCPITHHKTNGGFTILQGFDHKFFESMSVMVDIRSFASKGRFVLTFFDGDSDELVKCVTHQFGKSQQFFVTFPKFYFNIYVKINHTPFIGAFSVSSDIIFIAFNEKGKRKINDIQLIREFRMSKSYWKGYLAHDRIEVMYYDSLQENGVSLCRPIEAHRTFDENLIYYKSLYRRYMLGVLDENSCCPVCLSNISCGVDPKLQCGHGICFNCFLDLFKYGGNFVKCPLCRRVQYYYRREKDFFDIMNLDFIEREGNSSLDNCMICSGRLIRIFESYKKHFNNNIFMMMKGDFEQYVDSKLPKNVYVCRDCRVTYNDEDSCQYCSSPLARIHGRCEKFGINGINKVFCYYCSQNVRVRLK